MPRGSGSSSSGYNSQGNHYNTPGGSNSSSGSSYHCKLPRLASYHEKLVQHVIALSDILQTPIPTDPTTIRTTTAPLTTTLELDNRITLLLAARPRSSPLARSKVHLPIEV